MYLPAPYPTAMNIYKNLLRRRKLGRPQLAVLIDPEKYNDDLIRKLNQCQVDFIFVGGSSVAPGKFEPVIKSIRKLSRLPVVIFPGDEHQLSKFASGILMLSLLSGRNSEYLIGKHVKAAPVIFKLGLETIPTGYILLDGGTESATAKITGTQPLKQADRDLICATALAGEMLGMKLIYLEAGSGAKQTVALDIIKNLKQKLSIPLVVGGGIDSLEKAKSIVKAGADVIVVGNVLEKNPDLIYELSKLKNK